VRRRIALAVSLAGMAAALAWPTPAFADYNPNTAFVGTGTSTVVPCVSTLVAGSGFTPSQFVSLTLEPGSEPLGTALADGTGSFSTKVKVPAGTNPGTYTIVSSGGQDLGAFTSLTVGAGGCRFVPLLSLSTVDPGQSTTLHGHGCQPDSAVVFTLAGNQVGTTTADAQGDFSASIAPPGTKIGQVTVTAACGSKTFDVLLTVVATAALGTPEGTTAVFGVFVLLGLVLLWGQFGSSASRRRKRHHS
jgi:hypothetical protein